MEEITIDGVHENDFRRSIEDLLRYGEADSAAKRLRALVEPYSGPGGLLPARFRAIAPSDITLGGWGELEQSLARYDRPEHPISALALTIAEPEGRAPRGSDGGLISPRVETCYFSDEAYPFSEADRADLVDGYSSFGCEWAGDSEGQDSALSVDGVDDLYGALTTLEASLFDSDAPDAEAIRAGTVGSCYLAVLIHQALREAIRKNGLPRPLCVMASSNGVYPFFDAPVMSLDEYMCKGEIKPLERTINAPPVEPDVAHSAASSDDEVEHGSLLSIGLTKPRKKPVLVLAEADLDDNLAQMANAQFMSLGGVASGLTPPAAMRINFDFADLPMREAVQMPEIYEPKVPAADTPAADIFADPATFPELGEPADMPEAIEFSVDQDAEETHADLPFEWLTREPQGAADEPDLPDHITFPPLGLPVVDEASADEPVAEQTVARPHLDLWPSDPDWIDPDLPEPVLTIIPALPEAEEPSAEAEWPEQADAFAEVVRTLPVPKPYEPYREPEFIDTGDHDVWGALNSRRPSGHTASGEGQLAPGQEPLLRGHSLRRGLNSGEAMPTAEAPTSQSLLSRLSRLIRRR